METPGKGVRVKLHGKTQALSALYRHLGNRPAIGEEETEADGLRPVTVVTWAPFPGLLPDADAPEAEAAAGE